MVEDFLKTAVARKAKTPASLYGAYDKWLWLQVKKHAGEGIVIGGTTAAYFRLRLEPPSFARMVERVQSKGLKSDIESL